MEDQTPKRSDSDHPDYQVLRRQDLIDLGDAFREALQPLGVVVEHMKEQNIRYASTNRSLKSVVRWLWILTIGMLASFLILLYTLHTLGVAVQQLSETAHAQAAIERKLNASTREIAELRKTTESTNKKVEKVEERSEAQSRVELVPETDPVKARRAPVKLRVTAPAAAPADASAPAPSVVKAAPPLPKSAAGKSFEIPIPREAF